MQPNNEAATAFILHRGNANSGIVPMCIQAHLCRAFNRSLAEGIGQMDRTIKDVARLAGLSTSTVSRALNRSGYVSPDARLRVEEAMSELGFQPNYMARGLKGKPSRLIGLIIPDISNTFYTAIAHAVSSRLRQNNYELILCVNDEDPAIDLHYLQILQQKRVDGILYTHPAAENNSAFLRELAAGGMPIVELNRQREDGLFDAALADNLDGAFRMTGYLLGLGHRRIGLVLGEEELTTARDRAEGYRRAHRDADVPIDTSLMRMGNFTRRHGESAARELLALPDPPTAIFAGSNRILMGVLAVVNEMGLKVPGDISIASFDDAEWLSIWNPPITAVDVAIDEMANLAVDLLLRRTGEPSAGRKPVTYVLRAALVRRESCRTIAAAEPAQITQGGS